MTAGIVLAAGASRRMGSPKALLDLGGVTTLARVCRNLAGAGCDPVIVVLGAQAELVRKAVPHGATAILNDRWADGRTTSVQAGLAALPKSADAVILAPVDRPLFTSADVRLLIASRSPVAVPVADGQRGHPLLVRRPVFAEIAALAAHAPLHDVLHRDAARVAEVDVENPGVLINLDTPDDHRQALMAMRRWNLA